MVLTFDVQNQTIKRTDICRPTEGSKNYLRAKFSFTDDWTGIKTAIFGHDGIYKNAILVDDQCEVPWEIIVAPFFTVSVVCGDLITANEVQVELQESGYHEGDAQRDPTPDEYAQLTRLAERAAQVAQSVRDDADAGLFKGEKGETGAAGPQGDPGEVANISQGEGERSLVFNDEESNRALASNSISAGTDTISGCKGYYYSAIDFNNKKIYLSGEQVALPKTGAGEIDATFDTPAYDAGNQIGLTNVSHYLFTATIVSVENNVVTYDGDLGFTELLEESDVDSHVFFVPAQPEVGLVVFTQTGIALGENTRAVGRCSVASGRDAIAHNYSLVHGRNCKANSYSFVAGQNNTATGTHATIAGGVGNQATEYGAYAEGTNNISAGVGSHAEGDKTQSTGNRSHSEGTGSISSGNASHAEGGSTTASGDYSHAEGGYNVSSGVYSHSEGRSNTASGVGSHAEGGGNTIASDAELSHAEGAGNKVNSRAGHAEGGYNTVDGVYAHAEGYNTKAIGYVSHTEGANTKATGVAGHAEGETTTASGAYSHSEGAGTEASGNYSHAEGENTTASGSYSHSGGRGTKATVAAQTAIGEYNAEDENVYFMVGNGTSNNDRKNAFSVYKDGHAEIQTQGETPNSVAKKEYVDFRLSELEGKSIGPKVLTGSYVGDGTWVKNLQFEGILSVKYFTIAQKPKDSVTTGGLRQGVWLDGIEWLGSSDGNAVKVECYCPGMDTAFVLHTSSETEENIFNVADTTYHWMAIVEQAE